VFLILSLLFFLVSVHSSPFRLPLPRLATTLLKQFDITHHHASVYCFAHAIDCEEGYLDCGEQTSKKHTEPKPIGLKVRLKRTALGQKKEWHKSCIKPNPTAY